MPGADLSLGLAFLAGLASFLSPCVFSLVPAYVGYLGGRSAGITRGGEAKRWITFSHGLAFVIGFSAVFISLGVASSALGGVLFSLRTYLAKIGGIVVIIFGLHMIGVFRIPFLEIDTRRQEVPDQKFGYLSSFLMGIFFSAGWSPCVGPTLGLILNFKLCGRISFPGSFFTDRILRWVSHSLFDRCFWYRMGNGHDPQVWKGYAIY